MLGANTSHRPLPSPLAVYMASSALRRISSAPNSPPSPVAMPMLARTMTSVPMTWNGWRSRSTMRVATMVAARLSSIPCTSTANSSPPSRAARSAGPDAVRHPAGHGAEQLVTDDVSQAVVDRLEVVEVDEEHPDTRSLPR